MRAARNLAVLVVLAGVATACDSDLAEPPLSPPPAAHLGDAAGDRDVLVSLYDSTDGGNWKRNDNWLSSKPVGEWFGVVTDSAGRVIRLRLGDNSLNGPLSAELGDLSELKYLELTGNQLTGSIPPELGDLANLSGLWLDDNELAGPLPGELGDLGDLLGVWVDGNRLSGSVPTSFLDLELLFFDFGGDGGLCLPGTEAFEEWSEEIGRAEGPWCSDADAEALRILHETTTGSRWANSDGWLDGRVLGRWYGVDTDSIGRVSELDLVRNGLSGPLPRELGHLAELTRLKLSNNNLFGSLPLTLTALALQELRYADTDLCVPDDPSFQEWLDSIPEHEGTGETCPPLAERDLLVAIYEATGGPDWNSNGNWLTQRPLGEWDGVETDDSGNVTGLSLSYNNLVGRIPPELGGLSHLRGLFLRGNGWRFTGPLPREVFNLVNLQFLSLGSVSLGTPIPPEIGRLRNLRYLGLTGTAVGGPIPAEVGTLDSLEVLALGGNDLTGPIPPELGSLSALRDLYLWRNDLSGEIPPELGSLTKLERFELLDAGISGPIPAEFGSLENLTTLWLNDNDLSGEIPPELGDLGRLESLRLHGNALSGPLPEELGELTNLWELWVGANDSLSGKLPATFTELTRLQTLKAGGTGVCVPADADLLEWLDGVPFQRVARCEKDGAAYLTQAVQSREHPVPLVAGRPALLRVFVTSQNAGHADFPEVHATFYDDGMEVHVAEIEGGDYPIPKEVDESKLTKSANASIPGRYIRSGLEMVVEIDPDNTLDDSVDIVRRIPEEGRMAIDVKDMPSFQLTLIPFLYESDPDSSILEITENMADDPWEYDMMAETRELLPIDTFDIELHDPVVTSTNNGFELLFQTETMRLMEGRSGYWLGMLAPVPRGGLLGVANGIGSWSSFSVPASRTVAHELGHNLALFHAPCGGAGGPDPLFPDRNGRIGAWGYDGEDHRLVSPYAPDLMSYCRGNSWISDYHFSNSLRHRLAVEEPLDIAKTRSLIVWGGLDADGAPFLEPAFVAEAMPSLPAAGREFALRGTTEDGGEAFSLTFDMPEIPDIEDERSAFVFAIPVTWVGELERISLAGGGGGHVLRRETNQPMTILRDPATGQVRAILRAEPEAAMEAVGEVGLEAVFTRGVPTAGGQGR